MTTFPSGIYIGTHRGVRYYASEGKIQCLLGWIPHTFDSIHQCKLAITKWRKQ